MRRERTSKGMISCGSPSLIFIPEGALDMSSNVVYQLKCYPNLTQKRWAPTAIPVSHWFGPCRGYKLPNSCSGRRGSSILKIVL